MATRSKASRSAAAKKAAATRKRNAAKRSAAAKKAAATRKRNARKSPAKRKASTSKRGTKASRSAAAKKAAATRKRNAAKRSAAAKKAAATRKRNARKSPAKRKASTSKRSTKASRSAAAKKAAATRKRNANKRSRAAKKAAATRKRNSRGKRRGSVKSKARPTAAKRRAAAKKAAATRKRNAAKRSRAAKKAAATRKRNSRGKRRTRKATRRGKASRATKAAKSIQDSFMFPISGFPAAMQTIVAAALVGGLYSAIRPYVWDRMNLTGSTGYIAQAANMLPVLSDNVKTDLGNFGNKALHLGTIGVVNYVLSDKKMLGVVDKKVANSITLVAGIYYAAEMIKEIQTYNFGGAFTKLAMGDFSGAVSAIGASPTATATYGTLGGMHNNMGMMHGGNYSMGMSTMNNKFFGAHNQPAALPMPNNTIVNTAATRGTHGGNAIFGTSKKGLGRVNLF